MLGYAKLLLAAAMPGSEPHRLGLPTATGGLARLVAKEMLAAGVDPDQFLLASGLSTAQIGNPDERLGAGEQIAFVEAAALALGRDRLGFEIAREFDLRSIGLLYYVAASSDTLGEAVQRIRRFSAVANEAVVFSTCKDADLSIKLDYSGVARHPDRHQTEFFLATLVRLGRSLTGLSLSPVRVTICHARSTGLADYNAFFGCRTEFQADKDCVVFAEACRMLPVLGADPHLSEILVRYCEETLSARRKAAGSFRAKVENVIAPILPHGKPTAAAVAHKLNVSQRTLARRLAQEATSLAALLDEMRHDLAVRYLEDPNLSVSQVAWLLGFQEAAAFTHAFRRWTGKTPSMVRRPDLVGDVSVTSCTSSHTALSKM